MTETLTEPVVQDPAEAALAEITSKVVAEINSGSLTFADLLKALSPQQQSEPLPAVIPTAKAITPAQSAAMARVPEVYGRVVPVERRTLEPVEAEALVVEKQTLDEVKKMSEARLKDITVTIHNHLDVLVEENLGGTYEEAPLRDDNGNYVTEGRVGGPGQAQEFAREIKNYAASLNNEGLKEAEALGLMTHDEYLACTQQVRVVSEVGIMAALKKNPSLIKAVAHATVPGKKGTAVSLRKRQ